MIANGNVGIGVNNPSARLEVTSGIANDSGFKLTNLTSASPTVTGQAIGVDTNGKVVTISGSGGSATASNGLTAASGNVTLGGTLTSATTITQAGFGLSVSGGALTLNSGTSATNIGTDATQKIITIGNNTGTTSVQIPTGLLGIYSNSFAKAGNALNVNADALTTGSIIQAGTSSSLLNSGSGLLYIVNTGTSTLGTIMRVQANTTPSGGGLTLLANGKFGVGTTIPTNTLEINSTNDKIKYNSWLLLCSKTL